MSEIIEVSEESIPLVEIIVDENSAQSAIDAAAAAQAALDVIAAYSTDFNKIITSTGFSIVDDKIILLANWEWVLNGINKTNTESIDRTVTYASSGYQKIVLGVLDAYNSFYLVDGAESINNPSAPELPNNTLQATFILVTDGEISEPAPIISSNLYVPKAEKSPIIANGTGVIYSFALDTINSAITFTGTVTELHSIDHNVYTHLFNGRELIIGNEQPIPIELKHNVTDWGNYPLKFPNELDYILKPKEYIRFNLKPNLLITSGVYNYVGVISISHHEQQTGLLGGTTNEHYHLTYAQHLALTAIVSNWISYGATSTIVGWSSFTTKIINYVKIGNIVFVNFTLSGVSNSTSITFSLPTSLANPLGITIFSASVSVINNGLTSAAPGMIMLSNGSYTPMVSRDATGLAWTASGTKTVRGQFFYQV